MAQNEKDATKESEASEGERPQRRLLRSRDERMLWGVAGGLGQYLNIDPTLVRLGFAVATFFGGLGAIAYLVMAVVVPEDDGTGRPSSGRPPPTWAIVLLALAVLVVLPGPFVWGSGHGGYWGGPWWGFFGPLWILFLAIAGYLVYRALRGGRPSRPADRGTQGDDPKAAAADESTAETEVDEPPRAVRGIALVVLALAAICAALSVACVAAWATATGQGDVVAGIVIALGVAIAATAFMRGEARRVAPWLLASALVLGAPAGAVAAADIHFDGGIGERSYTPAAVADLPADGYEFGVGQLVVDLRELPWTDGQTVSLDSTLGIGQMVVSVPSTVCVDAEAKVKAGELVVRGETSDGVEAEIDQSEPAGSAPRLDLSADLQLGQLVVTDRDPDDLDHDDLSDSERSDERDSQREACAR
jgi:phage shock protein PspC (stress-responsive transcriptional regulator)